MIMGHILMIMNAVGRAAPTGVRGGVAGARGGRV